MSFYPYAVLQNYGIGNKYHNAFRSIHLASTMPKYSNFRKDYARLASYRKPVPGSTSGNALAIRSLQRKVAGLKPENQQHVITNNFSSLARNNLEVLNVSPTTDLAGAADRDERILGDSWKNKYLEIRASGGGQEGVPGPVRLVVYKPHKAGTTLAWSSFNAMIDPSNCTVLHDEIIKPYAVFNAANSLSVPQAIMSFHRKINLNNMKSTFIGTTPEEGQVRVVLLINGLDSTATTYGTSIVTKLVYANK